MADKTKLKQDRALSQREISQAMAAGGDVLFAHLGTTQFAIFVWDGVGGTYYVANHKTEDLEVMMQNWLNTTGEVLHIPTKATPQ